MKSKLFPLPMSSHSWLYAARAHRAKAGYAALDNVVAGLDTTVSPDLERAIELWTAALDESDLTDKKARINRKVAARLHENVGAARLALGDLLANSVAGAGGYDGAGVRDYLVGAPWLVRCPATTTLPSPSDSWISAMVGLGKDASARSAPSDAAL